MKQVLGSHGGYDIVSYRKDMKEYLNNNIKRCVFLISSELIKTYLLLIILYFIFRIKIAQNHEEIIYILSKIEQYLLV